MQNHIQLFDRRLKFEKFSENHYNANRLIDLESATDQQRFDYAVLLLSGVEGNDSVANPTEGFRILEDVAMTNRNLWPAQKLYVEILYCDFENDNYITLRDREKARIVFRQFANFNTTMACYYAHCSRSGIGVGFNLELSNSLYKWAADQGDANAQLHFGLALSRGEGIPKNKLKAAFYFGLAADQGDADAQCCLGDMLYHGDGIPKNIPQAIECFRSAANKRNERAIQNLAKINRGLKLWPTPPVDVELPQRNFRQYRTSSISFFVATVTTIPGILILSGIIASPQAIGIVLIIAACIAVIVAVSSLIMNYLTKKIIKLL
jgi:TPR repeat protein